MAKLQVRQTGNKPTLPRWTRPSRCCVGTCSRCCAPDRGSGITTIEWCPNSDPVPGLAASIESGAGGRSRS